jgi:hypothetical protein
MSPIGSYSADRQNYRRDYEQSPNPKCGFTAGGLQFSLYEVSLEKDPTGKRSFRTQRVGFLMPRQDQLRAFEAAIKEKYTATDSGVCSKYTCFGSSRRKGL